MDEDPVDALVATAPDGIAFDELRVDHGEDGYTFETPDASHTGLDENALRDIAADSPHAANWYFWHAVAPQTDHRWAFLRWLEGAERTPLTDRLDAMADGLTTKWGQLQITVSDDDGGRRYDLRHADDDGVSIDALETYEDPLDARELAKHDDDGGYRPLKTAPSLQTGWAFPELDAADLVETVHAFYPATVPNWYRERDGNLDVNHWHETVERQTGIYGVVKTWDRGEGHDHVNRVAEATCDDSQCLKRREWEYDEETELDVDGGDGEFPCREPCSLVITAARKWTQLEGEASQTYEFELTPSEKAQIEDIIDAVADGRTDEIREADIYKGANRYRARYLRAKLFDDDGNLCGVETDD